MSLIGLDLNATRARAVQGPVQGAPVLLELHGSESDLPLALSLEGRSPQVGRSGLMLCRRAPHHTCVDFLPYLGQKHSWTAGRHTLTASQALDLTFAAMVTFCGRAKAAAIALPAYLQEPQVQEAATLLEKVGLRVFGTMSIPLAMTVAAQAQLPWTGLALVLDIDGAALSWSGVLVEASLARLVWTQPMPRLALSAWINRLLEFIAHRCVRISRRDPRQSADAEQALFDQTLAMLQHGVVSDPVEFTCQGPQWSQHLMLHSSELAGACVPLVQQALAQLRQLLTTASGYGSATAVLVSPEAARLPGLVSALAESLGGVERAPSVELAETFAGNPPLNDAICATQVHVLDETAVARSAHFLACRVSRGDLPPGHHESAPLPETQDVDPGPARLQFRGVEHPLNSAVFTLGRAPDCNLVFDTQAFPTVSGRHCEIVLDRLSYTLRDRSRHGTLVNDRPVAQQIALHSGDWIRLGPCGPVVRFLGKPQQGANVTGR